MPFSERSMVMRLIVCWDCNKSSARSGVLLAKSIVRNYYTPSPLRYALTIKTRLEVELLCSVV
jgi:hypothetical protein